jgi:hypothetical protein
MPRKTFISDRLKLEHTPFVLPSSLGTLHFSLYFPSFLFLSSLFIDCCRLTRVRVCSSKT